MRRNIWKNKYLFRMNINIGDKSIITDFMVKHKMFPGNRLVCTTWMKPCYKKSLIVNIEVIRNNATVDRFEVSQGVFCKIMKNIYDPVLSDMLN